jgi:hypothetical protein
VHDGRHSQTGHDTKAGDAGDALGRKLKHRFLLSSQTCEGKIMRLLID